MLSIPKGVLLVSDPDTVEFTVDERASTYLHSCSSLKSSTCSVIESDVGLADKLLVSEGNLSERRQKVRRAE